MTPESHEHLVAALTEKAERLGWELNIVRAELLTKEEQFALAGRTTVSLLPSLVVEADKADHAWRPWKWIDAPTLDAGNPSISSHRNVLCWRVCAGL